MTKAEISPWAMEPFNVGRSTSRLLFDFGVMLSCFSTSANKRVLDFGAGTGWISEFLARSGYEVYALDIDANVMPVAICSRIVSDRRLDPKSIKMVVGSGMDLPFRDGFFSHICCFDTLHHMTDYPKTFREMNRVLESDGRAVFIEPGARHSRSKETIAFIETYKKEDPMWIERDIILEEITQISKESGFSNMIVLPTLLPGLKSYTADQWIKFRQGDPSLAQDFLDLLKGFNYEDHLSFYCDKSPIAESTGKEPSTVHTFNSTFAELSGKKFAVDLTPLLPGGENGGAKLMTIELVRALARLLPETSFVLFTAQVSHDELDSLEENYPNIQRMCVLHNHTESLSPAPSSASKSSLKDWVFTKLKSFAVYYLPERLKSHITAMPLLIRARWAYMLERVEKLVKRIFPLGLRKILRNSRGAAKTTAPSALLSLVEQVGANLLFCPFTAPFYADPLIPTVSVIYDLQYRAYPQFFTSEEVSQREENFRTAYQKANYLVTISEFVKQTVIEAANLSPENVIAVPIGLFRNPAQPNSEALVRELLEKYGLHRSEYILYPANFWRHKNHAMLLTAFNLYRQANPDSTLKLLCTGAPGRGSEAFCEEVRRMGLTHWVVYPGFVTPEEYDSLLASAFALIFPSLYEGFGIPLLEAMSAGVPVICSNVTSLPEVGGDAVLYFDPRRPGQIVDSLTRLVNDPSLRDELIRKGLQRARLFEGADRMAIEYSNVFVKALHPDK